MKSKTATKSAAKKSTKKTTQAKTSPEMSPMLQEFFVDELKDVYWAERHLTKALPKMQKAATSPELQQAFSDHLEQTKEHVSRLEQIFEMLDEKAVAKKCDAMAGIVEEGQGVIEDTEQGTSTRDVALIIAGQKAEHYEIATYGGLRQLALTMGYDDIASVLEQTLNEEKETDELLTSIAENNVNYTAANEDENENEE
jgi:ferritin-like metal-binding protein YciE